MKTNQCSSFCVCFAISCIYTIMVKLLFQFCQFAQFDIQQALHFLPFQTLYRLVFVCFYIISLDVCNNHSVANQQVKVTNINCLFHMFMYGVDRRMPHTLVYAMYCLSIKTNKITSLGGVLLCLITQLSLPQTNNTNNIFCA
jgi:hypothetical protein